MGEHYSSQPYSQDYTIKNINSIRHILAKNRQNSCSKWGTSLRTNIESSPKLKQTLSMKVKNF